MIVRITFLVIIKKILKWAENILSRNKLAGKKKTRYPNRLAGAIRQQKKLKGLSFV